jgi:hypothetical protein
VNAATRVIGVQQEPNLALAPKVKACGRSLFTLVAWVKIYDISSSRPYKTITNSYYLNS